MDKVSLFKRMRARSSEIKIEAKVVSVRKIKEEVEDEDRKDWLMAIRSMPMYQEFYSQMAREY